MRGRERKYECGGRRWCEAFLSFFRLLITESIGLGEKELIELEKSLFES